MKQIIFIFLVYTICGFFSLLTVLIFLPYQITVVTFILIAFGIFSLVNSRFHLYRNRQRLEDAAIYYKAIGNIFMFTIVNILRKLAK